MKARVKGNSIWLECISLWVRLNLSQVERTADLDGAEKVAPEWFGYTLHPHHLYGPHYLYPPFFQEYSRARYQEFTCHPHTLSPCYKVERQRPLTLLQQWTLAAIYTPVSQSNCGCQHRWWPRTGRQ